MFIGAIEIAKQFTRPIHTIERFYGSQEVYPGGATLFFVTADGWALTCRHVADVIIAGDQLAQRKANFLAELTAMRGTKKEKQILRELEQKFQLSRKAVFEIKNNFVNCVEGNLNFEIIKHPNIDVALLHFRDFTKLLCTDFPVFPKDSVNLKQGKFLCRIGFPFPEASRRRQVLTLDETIRKAPSRRRPKPKTSGLDS